MGVGATMTESTRPFPAIIFIALSCLASAGCSNSSSETYFDACEPSQSVEDCYAARRDPSSEQVALATAIAERYIEEHPATSEIWDWTSGVLMFAMTELYRVTGDTRLRDYYRDYLDFHVERGYAIVWSDSCPPALTALALLRESNDPRYQKVVDDVLSYLRTAKRTRDGGISHIGATAAPAIWVDSLFMFGMVLNREGELADDPDALALMSEQLRIFSEVLQDDDGLFVHADDYFRDFDTDIYWARGNSWVTASLADYLRVRRLRGESDRLATQMFLEQTRALLAAQDQPSGMWWTVLNRPGDTYLETSAAALFAYGMARAYRYGIVGQRELDAAKRAVDGVLEAVELDEEGRPYVSGISGPTDVSTFEGYASVPLEDDLNYGVGAVILALLETSGV